MDKVNNKHLPTYPWQVRAVIVQRRQSYLTSYDISLWQYAVGFTPIAITGEGLMIWFQFGDSQITLKAKLPQIVQAVIRYILNISVDRSHWRCTICSNFASPESETSSNTLVVVGHNIQGDLTRLEEMKISEWLYLVFFVIMGVEPITATLHFAQNCPIMPLWSTQWYLSVLCIPVAPAGLC